MNWYNSNRIYAFFLYQTFLEVVIFGVYVDLPGSGIKIEPITDIRSLKLNGRESIVVAKDWFITLTTKKTKHSLTLLPSIERERERESKREIP